MTVLELMKILQSVDNNAVVRIISKDNNPIDDYCQVQDAYTAVPMTQPDFIWWRTDICEIQ